MPAMKGKPHDRVEIERLLARKRREGLTYHELAEESGIPAGTLASWASKLARAQAGRSAFVEVATVEDQAEEVEFEPSGLELPLESGHRVTVGRDFDASTLRRLVEALAC